MLKFCIVIVGWFIFNLPAWAERNLQHTLLVLGDSLSAGYGIDLRYAWVNQLNARLQTEAYPYRVINASISGETTAGGKQRLPALINQYRPNMVLVELGANDGLRGLSIKAMQQNLDDIVKELKAAGAQCLIIGMRIPPNYGPFYTDKFQRAFGDVAKKHNIALVPFMLERFADNPKMFIEDGVHPTAQAQTMILDTIWPKLKPLLKK